MLKLILATLVVAIMPCVLAAQDPFAPSDVISVTPMNGAVLSVHADGTMSLSDGWNASFVKGGGQGPIIGSDQAVFTTKWQDKTGATHQVQTPVVSTTQTGIQKAVVLHKQLVDSLQQLYPPVTP